MNGYGPGQFLNDGLAIETEEPSKSQIFEIETRPAMIVTIAMATRMTQPECAIEARHVNQLFG